MSDQHWYYEVDGRQVGPFESREMCRIVQSGMIGPDTAVIAPDGRRGRASQLVVRPKPAPSLNRERERAGLPGVSRPFTPPPPPPPPTASEPASISPPRRESDIRTRNSYHRTAIPLMWTALGLTGFSVLGQIQAGTAGIGIATFVLMLGVPTIVTLVTLYLSKPPMPLIVVSMLASLALIGFGGLFLSQLTLYWAGVEPIMTTTFALVFICAGLCGALAFLKSELGKHQKQEVDG